MFCMSTPIRTAARRRQKPGPRGMQFWPTSKEWKAEIRRRLIERSWSQAELARQVGASPAAIVLIFKAETIQSRLVPAIHKALGLDPPSLAMTVEAA